MSLEAACRATHPQICGDLPLVRHPDRRPAIRSRTASHTPGERRWDIARVKSDLYHEDGGVRLITIKNVRFHCPKRAGSYGRASHRPDQLGRAGQGSGDVWPRVVGQESRCRHGRGV